MVSFSFLVWLLHTPVTLNVTRWLTSQIRSGQHRSPAAELLLQLIVRLVLVGVVLVGALATLVVLLIEVLGVLLGAVLCLFTVDAGRGQCISLVDEDKFTEGSTLTSPCPLSRRACLPRRLQNPPTAPLRTGG